MGCGISKSTLKPIVEMGLKPIVEMGEDQKGREVHSAPTPEISQVDVRVTREDDVPLWIEQYYIHATQNGKKKLFYQVDVPLSGGCLYIAVSLCCKLSGINDGRALTPAMLRKMSREEALRHDLCKYHELFLESVGRVGQWKGGDIRTLVCLSLAIMCPIVVVDIKNVTNGEVVVFTPDETELKKPVYIIRKNEEHFKALLQWDTFDDKLQMEYLKPVTEYEQMYKKQNLQEKCEAIVREWQNEMAE